MCQKFKILEVTEGKLVLVLGQKYMTEDSKELGICSGNPVPDSFSQCAIFCLRVLFRGLFLCNLYSNGRSADVSYITGIFSKGNKSSTDAGKNQS